MKFLQISLFPKDEKMRCFSCTLEIEGLGEIQMKELNVSDQTINMLQQELAMQIMQRLGRDFGEVFNAEKTIYREGNKKEEVLPVQEQGSAPVADMLGSESVSSDMP